MLGRIKDVGGHPEQHFPVGRDANEFFFFPLLDPELMLSGVNLKSVIQRNLRRRKNKTLFFFLNSSHTSFSVWLEWPDTERENWHLKTNGSIAGITSCALDGDAPSRSAPLCAP